MSIEKRKILLLIFTLIVTAACTPTTGNDIGTTTGTLGAGEGLAGESEATDDWGDLSYDLLAEDSGALNPDAVAFAEQEGLSLEEANQRLVQQQTIGDIQPLLASDLSATFGGLWIEHQPDYRIVIALTEGDRGTIRPYIEDKEWAGVVEVRTVDHTLEELIADQVTASQAAQKVNVSVITAVDVINNRVELMVGNPELFLNDLVKAGIDLPGSVVVMVSDPGGDLPDTNRGVVFEATAADGRTIYLPKQPPTNVSMAALMEGTLLEVNGCLRLSDEYYADGFLVLWPYHSDIREAGDHIEVINGEGQAVARVGERLRAGGGAMESSLSATRIDETIPGMPIEGCPGPYWVAAELETLVEQQIPDVYFESFSSGGRILARFVSQSRPSQETDTLTGELQIDEDGCLRLEQYLIIWPPGIYLREEPLRIVGSGIEDSALVGGTIQLTGGEKSADDYRYFDNKVSCSGPFWGVNTIALIP
ncbi:MAG: hypothetical protein WA996_16530 [Candidatus Promineifilaceae bacterium]